MECEGVLPAELQAAQDGACAGAATRPLALLVSLREQVMAFYVKLGSLLVKQVSKPLASQLKTTAVQHPVLQSYLTRFGQRMHEWNNNVTQKLKSDGETAARKARAVSPLAYLLPTSCSIAPASRPRSSSPSWTMTRLSRRLRTSWARSSSLACAPSRSLRSPTALTARAP